jgi:pyruvate,water dikinase
VKDIREEWKLLQGLEWTIPLAKEGEKQDIFITTINLVKPDISSASLMEKDQLLIKGLGASLGSAIAPARVMINLDSQSQTEGQILVTHNITPEWINLIRQSQGIITETGGMTSHAAILAREFRLPAVVGAKNATHLINSGDTLCINGANGEIHRVSGFSESQLASQFPPFTNQFNYPIATKLLVNLSQVSSLNYVSNLPIDGIGLLRSELLLLELFLSNNLQDITGNKNQTVFKEKYTASLIKFASAFYPRPVFYRFLDLGEDVPLRFDKQMPKYRGTYNYCLQPELLDIQLEVLVGIKQQGYDNLILVLPFVRAVEEFKFCRRIIDNFYSITDLPIWIMAEVPSVLFLLPEYVKAGVQGITIGTNDLTWLLLGSDRQNLLEKLTVNHPAVLTAIKQLIQQANALEIPCSICGLAPVQYPDLIDKFIEWGVTSISVEVDAIVQTYNAIARAEQRLLLKQKGRVK